MNEDPAAIEKHWLDLAWRLHICLRATPFDQRLYDRLTFHLDRLTLPYLMKSELAESLPVSLNPALLPPPGR